MSRPHPRIASRSSLSSGNSRVASHSNSESSLARSSPTPFNHPSHRYHHNACPRPMDSPKLEGRFAPEMSRSGSTDSTRRPALSSYLQEKLDKERKAESEKMSQAFSRSRTNSDMADAPRTGQQSPSKSLRVDRTRPSSSGGSTEVGAAKPMGLKEMETEMSNLHRLNWALKNEIFLRCKKEEKLEERINTLESEYLDIQKQNDQLMEELEQRDKAVEEAVAMIVSLELKIDQLAGKSEGHHNSGPQNRRTSDEDLTSTPTKSRSGFFGGQTLERMPSFLWDRTDKTENLRNTYLTMKNSLVSLSQHPEETPEPHERLASPTVSMLSESSFMSIYGRKGQDDESGGTDLDDVSPISGHDGVVDAPLGTPGMGNRRLMTDMDSGRSPSLSRSARAEKQQGAVTLGSPLQRIERWSPNYASRKEASRAQDLSGVPITTTEINQRDFAYLRQQKEQKRASLSRVVTEAPGGARLHDDALPPTPDTISTQTLRRLQNSDDTLSGRRRELAREHDEGAAIYAMAAMEAHLPMPGRQPTTAPLPQRIIDTSGKAPEDPVHGRGNDWGSESDLTEDESRDSSLDMWMQAGAKPDEVDRSVSPDLFRFPQNKGSWATNAIFGRNSVQPSGEVDITKVPINQMHDLFSIQNALFDSGMQPTTPERRSSLHARAISLTTASPKPVEVPPVARASPVPSQKLSSAQKQRRYSDVSRLRSQVASPVQSQSPQPGSEQKRRNYPPMSGQQARSGLNRLFRRSIGGGIPIIAPDPIPTPKAADAASSGSDPEFMGIPSRVSRTMQDDLRSSATPPPIMRHMNGRRDSLPADMSVPTTPMDATFPSGAGSETPRAGVPNNRHMDMAQELDKPPRTASSPVESRRKWLPGFGRNSSLKNRAA
ncbi:hypothetical protein B0I35DRAFT_353039 [Stachybotrys elegans]|uniref:Centrosomin N-terminal motif 1 domain-containing protein n=1 Tax=Stachybotrys elegans TaxID=80388 RepID=A0A8K0SSF4_9HYPO|nr:hypothetical protein B0I35DRAFT_353039 [Stachybotrys elegans]